MRTVYIYSSSKKLADILQTAEPITGYRLHFCAPSDPINPSAANIIITHHWASHFHPAAKYILCTSSPQDLSPSDLAKLYDIWPLPLTKPLAHFLFRNILLRLKYELENTSEHLEHQKRILEMARQDYLTGLATRWYLQDFIESTRHERNITCIYLDLDNFKSVNDTYGHQAGDRALAATAEMMQNVFPDAFAARMGGDEFMLVLLGKRDILSVQQKVNDFMSRLLKYYAGTRTMQALSVSAGVSQSAPDSEKTIDRLIHEADKALYEAKKAGKAQCKVYAPSMN